MFKSFDERTQGPRWFVSENWYSGAMVHLSFMFFWFARWSDAGSQIDDPYAGIVYSLPPFWKSVLAGAIPVVFGPVE